MCHWPLPFSPRGVPAALCLLAAAAGPWCLSAAAQAARPDTLRLKGVQVAGSRREAAASVAAQAQRLDPQAARRQGIGSLADALRRMSGTNVRDYGGAGGLKTLSVHGLGAAHTIVALDGLSLTDSRAGEVDLAPFDALGALSGATLSMADVEELLCPVRHLGAALLELRQGADELGAPADNRRDSAAHLRARRADAAPRFLASADGGSFGTVRPALSAAQRLERGGWDAGAAMFYGLNNYPFTVHNGVATERRRRRHNRLQTWSGTAGGWLTTGRGSGTLRLRAHYYRSRQQLPGPVRYYVADNDERMAQQEAFGQALWRGRPRPHARLLAAVKYSDAASRYVDPGAEYPGGALRQNYHQREIYATAGGEWRPLGWLAAALASDVAYAHLQSNQPTDDGAARTTWMGALSVRAAARGLSLTVRLVGHRVWNHLPPRSGRQAAGFGRLAPSFSAAWTGSGRLRWALRAYYKETFRAPTFTECYYYQYGSPDVRPELAHQGGAGVQLATPPHRTWQASLRIDAFGARIADRITAIPISPQRWRTTNIGRVRSAGLEAAFSLGWRPSARQRWSLDATYTQQHLRNATPGSPDGLQLPYTPEHVASAVLTWAGPWLDAAVRMAAVGERWSSTAHYEGTRLPPYVEWGASVGRCLSLGRTRLDVRLDADNLLGREYEIIRTYPMPGRAFKLRLSLAW